MIKRWAAVCLLLGLCSMGRAAHADVPLFTVTPLTSELPVAAGAQQSGTIRIAAPAARPGGPSQVKVRAYVMDWDLDRQGAPRFTPPGTTADSCSSWMEIGTPELTVAAGTVQELRYSFKVPAAASGTYRTVIMLEPPTPPRTRDQPSGVVFKGRIGHIVYLHVGPQSRRARVTQLKAEGDEVRLTVENTGTAHVRLKGVVRFQNESGKIMQQVDFPGGVVLPRRNNTRDFLIRDLKLPESGKYTVTVILDYGGEALLGAKTTLHRLP